MVVGGEDISCNIAEEITLDCCGADVGELDVVCCCEALVKGAEVAELGGGNCGGINVLELFEFGGIEGGVTDVLNACWNACNIVEIDAAGGDAC